MGTRLEGAGEKRGRESRPRFFGGKCLSLSPSSRWGKNVRERIERRMTGLSQMDSPLIRIIRVIRGSIPFLVSPGNCGRR